VTLAELAAAFCDEVEREERHRASRGAGGQTVTHTGDWCSAPPSTLRALSWWARQMRAALEARP
jgi:hypothetical protein